MGEWLAAHGQCAMTNVQRVPQMSKPGDLTLICFALKEEATPFRKIAARHPGVVTMIAGIGRANAEKSIRSFLGGGGKAPELVLTCGFAGGLNPELKTGDVAFETTDEQLHAKLLATGAKPTKFFCADRIATTVAEKKQLREQTGADAVEMESGAIHAVCAERRIPCVTVRVISDAANEDLPLDFNTVAKPDKNLDYGKLAWAIAKSPGKIPALMGLQKKTRFAAEKLAEVLAKII
jgi:adenosylhomocysteine nucleosidase